MNEINLIQTFVALERKILFNINDPFGIKTLTKLRSGFSTCVLTNISTEKPQKLFSALKFL